ncbi:nucleotidyltransferase family protein [uncultured Eubacterium sp.]|uniref:nucleotidyltransferase family protein n=1 Tax=uncultured Eubacterium sp. TaxID=165185 RepID=UPI0026015BC5|nr:nucleotidyltransferase family protein [uncultured Eubacterium sp.]
MLDINTDYGYFLHLAKCALNDLQPKEKPPEVIFENVFQIARRHSVPNLLWYSIEKLNHKSSPELMTQWFSDYGLLLRQTAYQELEAERLTHIFTSRGFDVMPLKGSQIRCYYPQPDMRAMGDIDFMVKTDGSKVQRDVVKQIMLDNGYVPDVLDDGQVDAYKREDNDNVYVEVHFEFMAKKHPHYDDFIVDWNSLLPTETDGLYKMSLSDLYYFNIGHFVKNMFSKGIGVKNIVDIYVLWHQLSKDEQFKMNSRLLAAGLNDFNICLVKIADVWFGDKEDDGSTELVQDYILCNSEYGFHRNNKILNLMKNEANYGQTDKKKYIKDRIFPSASELYGRFGIKKKMPFLLPFLWFARVILLLFAPKKKIEKIKNEVEVINDISQEEIEQGKKVFEQIGLDYKKY